MQHSNSTVWQSAFWIQVSKPRQKPRQQTEIKISPLRLLNIEFSKNSFLFIKSSFTYFFQFCSECFWPYCDSVWYLYLLFYMWPHCRTSEIVEVVQMKNSLMTNNYMSINDLSCKMQCRILTSIGMKLKKWISFLTT